MNECRYEAGFDPAGNRERVNRWIVSQLAQVEPKVRRAIEDYRFNEAAQALYQFIWNTYCDWYLEFAKPLRQGDRQSVVQGKSASVGGDPGGRSSMKKRTRDRKGNGRTKNIKQVD